MTQENKEPDLLLDAERKQSLKWGRILLWLIIIAGLFYLGIRFFG